MLRTEHHYGVGCRFQHAGTRTRRRNKEALQADWQNASVVSCCMLQFLRLHFEQTEGLPRPPFLQPCLTNLKSGSNLFASTRSVELTVLNLSTPCQDVLITTIPRYVLLPRSPPTWKTQVPRPQILQQAVSTEILVMDFQKSLSPLFQVSEPFHLKLNSSALQISTGNR